ncbi:HpcH/HpaI aldolase family protein [Lachnoclostridium edouardi]|uniref:HpcH/HpaI aldolase family protein n=1 Tax=Lachnoclostridium edouardi TaxID=1926283 RepID=UPI000C7AABEA|nr:aldolase/citrate lyase family protein [Lachnoclostridium edouardi]
MYYKNQFRQLLNDRAGTVGTRLHSTWPIVTEAVGALGKYDYIEFTAEYAPYNQYDLENIVRAAEVHHMMSMIKVDYQNRGFVAQKAVASGFQSVLFTDHTSPEEVEETIKLILPKCPAYNGKMGYANRRWIGYQSTATQEEYAQMAAETVKAFMIEKKEAVDCIEEICSVPGIDMIQFGPNDFALSSGFNMRDDKKRVQAAEKKVIETAISHGIRPRCELNSAEEARYYLDLGVKDFSIGLELRILQNFLADQGDRLLNLMAEQGLIR